MIIYITALCCYVSGVDNFHTCTQSTILAMNLCFTIYDTCDMFSTIIVCVDDIITRPHTVCGHDFQMSTANRV